MQRLNDLINRVKLNSSAARGVLFKLIWEATLLDYCENSQVYGIIEALYQDPPQTQREFNQCKKDLDRSLNPEQKLDVFFIASERESLVLRNYLNAEVEFDKTSFSEKKKCLARLKHWEKKVEVAALITLLASAVKDHQLRGNIRYITNYLKKS